MAVRGTFNTKSPTIKRILREASELSETPSADYAATPLDDNLFEWHFTLRGPPGEATGPNEDGGPYRRGIYHGRIVLPPSYPLRPPSFRFLTPSGRFETNREICLSISGHHEETWQPAWGLRTALVALRTFMETDAKGQLGGLECTDAVRRRMAAESRSFRCSSCGKTNEAILQESEAAVEAGSGSKTDGHLPPELTMGYRDTMQQKTRSEAEEAKGEKEKGVEQAVLEDDESARLAEGFVATNTELQPAQRQAQAQAQERASNASTSEPSSSPPISLPAAQAAQSVPRPTATIPPIVPQRQPGMQRRADSIDGIPGWVDKAIVGIVACLVVMVLKMLFAF